MIFLAFVISILILLEDTKEDNLINKVNFSFIEQDPISVKDKLELRESCEVVNINDNRAIIDQSPQIILKKFQFNCYLKILVLNINLKD